MLRLGCPRSPLKEETLGHFFKTLKVSEVSLLTFTFGFTKKK